MLGRYKLTNTENFCCLQNLGERDEYFLRGPRGNQPCLRLDVGLTSSAVREVSVFGSHQAWANLFRSPRKPASPHLYQVLFWKTPYWVSLLILPPLEALASPGNGCLFHTQPGTFQALRFLSGGPGLRLWPRVRIYLLPLCPMLGFLPSPCPILNKTPLLPAPRLFGSSTLPR